MLDHHTLVILLVAKSSRDTPHNDPPCHESREQSTFGGSSPLLTTMNSMREPAFHQEEVSYSGILKKFLSFATSLLLCTYLKDMKKAYGS